MRQFVASLLEVCGLAGITAGAWMASEPLGVAVAGGGLLLIGVALDRDV